MTANRAATPLLAAAAYRAAGSADAGTPTAGATGGFGAALQGAVEAGHAADAGGARALTGQGGVAEAVLAVSRAELALQTAVAVRDRVVSAYQDVMRMPI